MIDEKTFTHEYLSGIQTVKKALTRLGCTDQSMMDDLTQTAWAKAWEKRDQYLGNSSISTWVTRIAINLYYGQFRKSTRHEVVVDVTAMYGNVLADTQPNLLDNLISRQNVQAMTEVLAGLPSHFRKALEAYIACDGVGIEGARLLGINYSTMKTYLHRSRRMARRVVAVRNLKALSTHSGQ